MNATISDSPPAVTFSDAVEIPSRYELESALTSIVAINSKLKALDREVGLSKLYISKCVSKPGQGRLSPVDGDSDVRWKLRDAEQGKRGARSGGRSNSPGGGGAQKFPNVPFDDKMED